MIGKEFSVLTSNAIIDYQFLPNSQVYPLYFYDDMGMRHYAISEYALRIFREHYNDSSINEEDIFYYIYAVLHHKGYLEEYKNELSKEAPRIPLSRDFKKLSPIGKELAELHINYESYNKWDKFEYTEGLLADKEAEDFYDVEKMKIKDSGRIIEYNKNINIIDIPQKAYEYKINSKSAIDWVIERYQISNDKDSRIVNNPNLYAGGKYIFELMLSIINMSVKSAELI